MLRKSPGKSNLLISAICIYLSACGGGGSGTVSNGDGDNFDDTPNNTAFVLSEVTDKLLSKYGSQEAATDVLLLAIDNEYSAQQILDAVLTDSSVLESDGFIFDSSGDVLPGDVALTPLAISLQNIGFRAIFDNNTNILELRNYLIQQAEILRPGLSPETSSDRFGASDLLLALFLRGYSGEQIQQAVIFGYYAVYVNIRGSRLEVKETIHLRNELGAPVLPKYRKNDIVNVTIAELAVKPSLLFPPFEVLPPIVENPPVTLTNGYVLNYIEIPEDYFRTEGSVVCDTTVLETKRTYECVSARNPDELDFVIEHTYVINTANSEVFEPGSTININITAIIDGYSFGYSVGNTINARFEPGPNDYFEVTSHIGKGIGASISNSDLPATGNATLFDTERSGRDELSATISGKVPTTDANELRIVLTGGNGASVVVYHLCRQSATCSR